MRSDGTDAACSVLDHQFRCFCDGSCCVDHIVYKNDVCIFDVSYDMHLRYFVRTWTSLATEDKRTLEELGVTACFLECSGIWCCDDEIGKIEFLYIRDEDGRTVEMVDGNVEETLFLISVQIHCDESVNACDAEHICDEFGADSDTRFVFSVLTSPSEVGNDCVDRLC